MYCGKVAVRLHVCMGEYCGGDLCGCVFFVCVCVCWGESRCSGADSSALCILKPPSPPAAKIELGGGGGRCMGGGERDVGGRRGKEGVT